MFSVNLKINSKMQFVDVVKSVLTSYFKDVKDIKEVNVKKNNGVVLTGLTVINEISNLSPTVYMEPYYARYEDGEKIDNLVQEIISVYEANFRDSDFDVESFTNFENVKQYIMYKLINKEKNEELLKEVPYIEYLDMAVVFYCLISCEIGDNASILIKNEHLKLWNVSISDISQYADINTKEKLGFEIRDLGQVLKDILYNKFKTKYEGKDFDEDIIEDLVMELMGEKLSNPPVSMYVLSNKNNIYGASCIMYKNILNEFAKKVESDLIILPSSIHEVLIIPEKELVSKDNLSEMVKEVNSTQVAVEEVLSDSVYIYRSALDSIEIY